MIRKIYLIGNPNVGKSVVFSRLTGVQVMSSNYPGTTVEFVKGYLSLGDEKIDGGIRASLDQICVGQPA